MDNSRHILRSASEIMDLLRQPMGLGDAIQRVKSDVGADFLATGIVEPGHHEFALCDYPAEWKHVYIRENMWTIDPVVRFHQQGSGAADYWFRALRAFPIPSYLPLMTLSLDLRMRFGLAGAVHDRHSGRVAIFSVCATQRNFHPQHKLLLDIVLPHLYLALHGNRPCSRPLTAREIEVLRWIAAGKTNWEISHILKVSENTIKFHVKNIHHKLKTTNKHHAVAVAMALKIFS